MPDVGSVKKGAKPFVASTLSTPLGTDQLTSSSEVVVGTKDMQPAVVGIERESANPTPPPAEDLEAALVSEIMVAPPTSTMGATPSALHINKPKPLGP